MTELNFNKAVFPGTQGGPLERYCFKAIASKEALDPSFKEYAKQIKENAHALAVGLQDEGFKIVSMVQITT